MITLKHFHNVDERESYVKTKLSHVNSGKHQKTWVYLGVVILKKVVVVRI